MYNILWNEGRNWVWTCASSLPPLPTAWFLLVPVNLSRARYGSWGISEVTWFAQYLLRAEENPNSQGNYYHHWIKMLMKKLDFKVIHLSILAEKAWNLLGIMLTPSLSNKNNDFIWTYCCPQPMTVVAKADLCILITGFILPEKKCLLLEQLWHCFDEPKLSSVGYTVVQGFPGSPVSWRENEHGFWERREHLYNSVIF